VSNLEDAWEIMRADVDDGLGVGDVAVLVGRIHYRGKGGGVETACPRCHGRGERRCADACSLTHTES
jgi:hypothetical protein